jgi:biotin carboxyl carrier protein
MNYKIRVNGADYEVHIRKVEGAKAHLTVNDIEYEVDVEGLATNPTRMSHKPEPRLTEPKIPVAPVGNLRTDSLYQLKAPLPGTILEMYVSEGDQIKSGQVLFMLEAMKMENNIEAEREGIIEKIHRTKGDTVLEGDVILIIK